MKEDIVVYILLVFNKTLQVNVLMIKAIVDAQRRYQGYITNITRIQR